MKVSFVFILGVMLSFIITDVYSQNQKYQFEINSTAVKGEVYPIEIVLPEAYDSTLRYPIVYVTDWWFSSQIVLGLCNTLSQADAVIPFIIVGISNHGELNDWRLERFRDLTPTNIPEDDHPDSLGVAKRGITGGSPNFLKFIKEELIPTVEEKFLSDTINRGIVGYSLGGLFSAFVLTEEPQLFQHYLIGSPSLSYDDSEVIKSLERMPSNKLLTVKTVFISVGEEESGNSLKGFADFRDLILEKDLPNIKLESIIIEDADHSSAVDPTIIEGFQFLYGSK